MSTIREQFEEAYASGKPAQPSFVAPVNPSPLAAKQTLAGRVGTAPVSPVGNAAATAYTKAQALRSTGDKRQDAYWDWQMSGLSADDYAARTQDDYATALRSYQAGQEALGTQKSKLDMWDISGMYSPWDYTPEKKDELEDYIAMLEKQVGSLKWRADKAKTSADVFAGILDEQKRAEEIETLMQNRMGEFGSYAGIYNNSTDNVKYLEGKLKEYSELLSAAKGDGYDELVQVELAGGGHTWQYQTDEEKRDAAVKEYTDKMTEISRQLDLERAFNNYARGMLTEDEGAQNRIASAQETVAAADEQILRDYAGQAAASTDYMSRVYSDSELTPEAYAQELLSDRRPNDQWTQKEKDTFYLIYTEQGEDAASRYAVGLNKTIREENRNSMTAGWAEWGRSQDMSKEARASRSTGDNIAAVPENALRGTLALLGNVATAPVHLFNWLDNIYQYNQRGGYYAGNEIPRMTDYTGAAFEARANALNQSYGTINENVPVLGDKGFGDLYQLVESVVESLVYAGGGAKAFAQGVGEEAAKQASKAATYLLFFGQAADASYQEAIDRGYSHEQATVASFFAGLAEAAGEEFSVEHLLDDSKILTKGFGKYILEQSLVEGSEEGLTDVLDLFGDELAAKLTDNISGMKRDILNLTNQGVDYEDAKRQVWTKFAEDAAFDILGGMFSGGVSGTVMGGPQALKNSISAAKNKVTQSVNRAALVDMVERQVEGQVTAAVNGSAEGAAKAVAGGSARSLANAIVAETRGERLSENQVKILGKNREIVDAIRQEMRSGDESPVKPYGLDQGEYAEEKRANIREGQDEAAFAEDFDIVADVFGFSRSYENEQQAWDEIGERTELSREQFRAAFEAGRARLERGLSSTLRQSGSGKVSFEAYNDGTTEYAAPTEADVKAFQESARYDVLQKVAKAAGVDLVFFKAGRSAVNGQYLGGKVYLNMDAAPSSRAELGSYVMQTAAHELTHYLREKSPAQYVALKDFVTDRLIKTGKLEDGKTLFELMRDKRALYARHEQEMSMDGVLEEVIADACEMVLKDNSTLIELEKADAKTAKSFRQFMQRFLRRLRKAFTGAEATHAEAKAMQGVIRDLEKIWSAGVFGEGEAATQANKNAAQESGGKLALKEEEVSDVVRADDGTYIVRIDSARSGLNAIPKSQWGPAIANAIRTQLEGKAIMTEDGDIISFKRRSSREPLYGPNTGNLREQAKSTGDYTKLNDKWLSLEHAASLVATSRYESWSENHDPADTFKKDGMNHRRTFVNIDGKTHEVDIVTGLNLNEKDKHNYGDKFYDIKISEEPTTKTYGAVPSGAASPYKIKYVVGSSDVLSLAQKNRAVNNKSAKYTTGDTAGGEMQEAMRRAGLLSLKDEDAVSDRELLANTPLEAARNDGELRRLGDYKKQLDAFYTAQDELGTAENRLAEAWNSGEEQKIKNAQRELDRASARLSRADDKLRQLRETKPIRDMLARAQSDRATREAAADNRSAEEKQRSNKQLQADNKALREQVARLKRELRPTKDKTVRRSDARQIAQDILKDSGSAVSVNELTDVIERMGNYLVQTPSEQMDDAVLYRMANEIARRIVDSAEVPAETGMEEVHERLKSYLRGTKLLLGKDYIKDLGQETLAMWRRLNPGVAVSNESGTPVDSAYQELREMFGEGLLPDGVTHPADQLNLISGLLQDSGREQMYNPYRGYERETAARIADDIVNAVFSDTLRQTAPTMADKMQAMRERNRARIAEIKRDSQARIQEVRARERAQKWAKVDAVREYYRAKEANARERRGASDLRQKIRRLHDEMSRDLLTPRKGRYVPENLRKPIAELLESVNTDSGRSQRMKDAIERLNMEYRKIADGGDGSFVFDQTVADMLQKLNDMLIEKGSETSIYDMRRDELRLVLNTMRALNHTVRTAVKMVNYETERDAFQIAKGMMEETRRAAPKGVRAAFSRYFFSTARNDVVFRRLGGYRKGGMWEMMADMLDKAQLRQSQLQMEGSRIFEELMRNTKALDRMTSTKDADLLDIGLRDEDGNVVKVTRDIALKLYLDTLNAENSRHLAYGGLTVPDLRRYYKGKAKESYGRGSVRVMGYGEELSRISYELRHAETAEEQAEIEERAREAEARAEQWINDMRRSIYDQLGDYEKAWITAAQRFFNDFSQKTLNETTRAVYGFDRATVENYVPIHTDPAYRQASFEGISRDISLENAGFMKERILNAKNPMLAEGLVDVVAAQIDNVAKYAAMMPAVRNFEKVYGKSLPGFTTSVQAEVRTKFDENAVKYIDNIMTDLTSPRRTEGGLLGEYADILRGNLAAASLTLNPRVAMGQAASYPTAAAEIGWGPLVKAFGMGANAVRNEEARQEIAKWSPLYWYRMQGFYDTEAGDLRGSRTAMAKLSNRLGFLTNWIQYMDGATVGRLWYAAKAYVQEQNPELENGSDAFMEKTAEVFNRIVERTQPNYTTLQRPDILRNPNALVKQLTMFMTQRLQNLNILYDAIGSYNAAVRDRRDGKNGVTEKDVKDAQVKLTRAVTSQVAAAATITAFKFLADALLYSMKAYRDDDDELTAESIGKKLALNTMDSLASNFLWGAELYDAASKVITGDKYYGVSLNGFESITDALNTLVKTLQYATSDDKSREKTLEQLGYVVKNGGQLFGVPVTNTGKLISAVTNRVKDAQAGNGFLSYESEVKDTDERRARLLYRALTEGDEEAARRQYEAFGEKADANKALQKHIREQYKAGNMSDDEALEALRTYTDMSDYDSEVMIGKLKSEAETGIQYEGIKQAYLDGEIDREQAIDMQVEYGKEKRHNVEKEVRRWDCEKDTGYAYDKLQDYVAAGDITEDQAVEYRVKYGGQEEPDAIADVAKWMCEIETGIPYDSIEEYYANGWIDRETLVEDYKQYGLMDDETAERVAKKRDFIGLNNDWNDISLTASDNYWTYADPLDIDRQVFYDAWKAESTFKADVNSNGKTIQYSAMDKKLRYIDSLPLQPDQKTAIAMCYGISTKNINSRAPWKKR